MIYIFNHPLPLPNWIQGTCLHQSILLNGGFHGNSSWLDEVVIILASRPMPRDLGWIWNEGVGFRFFFWFGLDVWWASNWVNTWLWWNHQCSSQNFQQFPRNRNETSLATTLALFFKFPNGGLANAKLQNVAILQGDWLTGQLAHTELGTL